MTTYTAPRNAENPFTVLSTDLLRNCDLSCTEKGVMAVLLGLPQGWQPNARHLSTLLKEGTYAISKAIANLKHLGYLTCRIVRDAAGKFLRSEWDINEIPAAPPKRADVNGNEIVFDRPNQSSKNLRREAKNRGEKPTPQTRTAASFDPYSENPNLGSRHRSNIDTSSIQAEDLERDARARVQNLEEEKPSATEEGVLENAQSPTIEEEEFCERPKDSRSGESSATAEPVETKTEWANTSDESGKHDKTELKLFQDLLAEYGRVSGRKSPPGWAYTIVKNLKQGIPCTYWEEFKAGIPIGTGDKREWETAPGAPCTAVKQCLEERFLSKPGTTPIEAALQVARVLENPRQMAVLWEAIKARVVFLREEARRMAKIGVQSSFVDPWMRPKPSISAGEAAAALVELHSRLPEKLLPQSGQLTIEGADWMMPIESNATDEVQQPDDESEVIAAAKAKISAALNKFARPSKKRATLEANMVEFDRAGFITAVKEVESDRAGGEIGAEEEIW